MLGADVVVTGGVLPEATGPVLRVQLVRVATGRPTTFQQRVATEHHDAVEAAATALAPRLAATISGGTP